jgi:hypothetical protein
VRDEQEGRQAYLMGHVFSRRSTPDSEDWATSYNSPASAPGHAPWYGYAEAFGRASPEMRPHNSE